ncbi:phosphomannomutase/phosphoglucomutase [Methylomicrobium sp. Wu6]|uniref:phosphomannomutase/phosphoglucomutase n=1 Tax=Methylomicrobium sp. Wu6 TaxID=3107928 RepID=UPI002DD66DCC|nr:phosphomannomutase/phosphoglucomutase [Methylomicrobium sp. Wu6]MEC4746874.1 phosphomannomutase/phosphoglucomutase [Methylomicrobium sp. Wu6]
MFRLFSYLAAVSTLLLLISSAGIFWIASRAMDQSKEDAVGALAKGIGLSIATQIDLLNTSLDKMAQDTNTVQALASQNPESIRLTAAKLTQLLPHALNVRLLLPGITELDDKSSPPMTYADLNMVRETFSTNRNPLPAIQGNEPTNRHLAIARRIVQGKQTIGVLLASFDDDIIRTSIAPTQAGNGYIRLHQGKLLLGASGLAPTEEDSNLKIQIAGTNWDLSYGTTDSLITLDSSLMLNLILIPLGLMIAAFLFGYRLLSKMLTEDLRSTMRAFKDLMKNNFQGSYSTNLNEMKGFISTLLQYKRVMDHDGSDDTVTKKDTTDDLFGLSGFSTDVIDFGFDKKPATKTKPKAPESRSNESEIFKKPAQASVRQQPAPKTTSATSVPIVQDKPKIEKASFPVEKTVGPKDAIFRAYDIRGIVGEALTREVVYDIGRALGTEAKTRGCDTIVLARDGRNSSPDLSTAVSDGIISTGCDVLDIGMVPTPVLYFVAHHMEDQSGVMITGSHNPPAYNGVKMVIKGETLAEDRIQNLKKCIDSRAFTLSEPGTVEKNSRYVNDYIGTISDDVHLGRPMKVVVDCGNGVAGDIAPKLLRTIGCEVIELYCEIDGAFPNHHPDPSKPENLEELILAVKHYQADLGLAFDGDGDRLGVVDSNGKIIWPDRQMMLYVQNVLSARPGSEIIFDVKCSRHLASQIKKFGGRPTLWKSGHSLMKAKLRETGASLAGEMSGHIFFNDRWFGFDDALYTAARLIEILSEDTRTSAEVFAALPDSVNTPELNVTLEEGENFELIEKLLKTAKFPGAEMTTIDGLRVDFPDGFGLVRASNTTPSLVIRFEADTRESLHKIQQQFSQLIKTVKPDSLLPF